MHIHDVLLINPIFIYFQTKCTLRSEYYYDTDILFVKPAPIQFIDAKTIRCWEQHPKIVYKEPGGQYFCRGVYIYEYMFL